MSDSLGRILIVDDETPVLEVLGEYFTDKGYEVDTASDGLEALAAVPRRQPHLILLDVRMPGIDGVEVLRRIRALDATVPVIMVTANEDVALARETLKLGAFDYVAKPFDFGYLDRAVTLGLLQARGAEPAADEPAAASAGAPAKEWQALAVLTLRTVRAMAPEARSSTGARLEAAALAAVHEARAGRGGEAAEALLELDTLLAVANELGDIAPSAVTALEAALTAARALLSDPG